MMLYMTSRAKQSKKGVAPRVSRPAAERDPASLALIELRKVLKMSQAEFAIRLMNVAPITVYRLEKTDPPRGDTLLQLAEIADKADDVIYADSVDEDEDGDEDDGEYADVEAGSRRHYRLQDLRERFLGMFLDDVVRRAGMPLIQVVERGGRHHLFLLMRLTDSESMGAADSFVAASRALRSDDASVRSEAKKLLSTFSRAVGNTLSRVDPTRKKSDHPRDYRKPKKHD
jgi:transcriptional regulator with XRE-family HTH domain